MNSENPKYRTQNWVRIHYFNKIKYQFNFGAKPLLNPL